VAVVGLGLMGGSLARRLSGLEDPPRVLGVDVDPVRGARAREEGAVAAFGTPGDGLLHEADLIVLACPLRPAVAFLHEEGPGLPPGTVLTDLVSLNAPMLRAAVQAGVAARLVTAHPMCGSAESGFSAAREDLYDGQRVWLSATDEASPELRRRVTEFWARVGARPQWKDAEEHDRMMAWVSHLPQLVSSALAGALDSAGFRPEDLGPGGRDMTRLAGSSAELWKDMLEHSAPVTGAGLTSMSRALNAVADLLARREMDRIAEFMELTRSWVREEDSLAARAEEEDAG
jgi:prephenate dehydrogenase